MALAPSSLPPLFLLLLLLLLLHLLLLPSLHFPNHLEVQYVLILNTVCILV